MKNELKTAAAYIRVSTDNQTELSPDSQIKIVLQYAKQHGYIIPKEYIFRDDGISGRYADKRPSFNEMIAAAKQKPSPFSAVLLWKFSRFARNQEESIFYKSMLRKNGIEVISVSEPIIDGPFGTLIERIIEWSDEYYSIRLSGEVKRGMTERVERGGAVSIPAFGYRIENKQYFINPDTAPIVKKIFSDYLKGIPLTTIARNLNDMKIKTARGNAWEKRTVEYIINNPVYTGKIRWNPKRRTRRNYDDPDIIITDGTHEPIIDIKVFEQAQELLKENRKNNIRHVHSRINEDFMLHGLVKCSDCGATLTMATKGKSLQCVNYIHGKCNRSHSISIHKINDSVIEAIDKTFSSGIFNLSVRNPDTFPDESEIDINTLINKEQKKLRRIQEAYEEGIYSLDELKESKQTILSHINALRTQQSDTSHDETKGTKKNLAEKYKNVVDTIRNPKIIESEKNELLKLFVKKIIFNRSETKIEILFFI